MAFNGINKRKAYEEEESSLQPVVKKKKTETTVVNIAQKNPVSLLNELKPGICYRTIEQLGPAHSPIFRVAVDVDGQLYEGRGGSKKLARYKAAEHALRSFIQLPNNVNVVTSTGATNIDFTSDRFDHNDSNRHAIDEVPQINSTQDDLKNTSKSAVMLLNELYPMTQYQCVENGSDVYSRFKVTVTIGNETFIGLGSRKRSAKHAAAAIALTKLLGETCLKSGSRVTMPYKKQNVTAEQQLLADHIGRMVLDKFSEVMKNDPFHIRRKVLAGIVMTKGSNINDSEIIGVTTGTKCVSGEHMSMSGVSLNDLHAEILARRCLLLYLYDQLELSLQGNSKRNDSIFEARSDNKGFKLKHNIQFHLYINTAPCGDARIFCPHEDSEDVDAHPHRSSRGQLRTKIESGEGTIPVKTTIIQSWDGVLQGERLLTMACSDKIARWNVLGLQGALLSHFIDPIYLKSVILGSLFKESHLHRAICGRIENSLQGLPPPYLLNRPLMLSTTSSEVRHPAKAPNFSVNWVSKSNHVEIVNTTEGKPEQGFSRLCKYNLMKRYIKICSILSQNIAIELPSYYSEAKSTATNYNMAKKQLFEAFSKAGLGKWVKKPVEQDQFDLN